MDKLSLCGRRRQAIETAATIILPLVYSLQAVSNLLKVSPSPLRHVATVVMETTQLVLSQFEYVLS